MPLRVPFAHQISNRVERPDGRPAVVRALAAAGRGSGANTGPSCDALGASDAVAFYEGRQRTASMLGSSHKEAGYRAGARPRVVTSFISFLPGYAQCLSFRGSTVARSRKGNG